MKRMSLVGIFIILAVSATGSGIQGQTAQDTFQKALSLERAVGDLSGAIALYQKVVETSADKALAAQAQLRIGLCYEKLGQKNSKQAQEAFQKVINDFPGQQAAVKEAKEKLSALLSAQTAMQKGDKGTVIRKLWSADDLAGDFGNFSPDGRYFAFHHWHSGDMAIRNVATGEVQRLNVKRNYVETPQMVGYCCWSPDGKQIAYDWNSTPREIRIVNLDGSNPHTIYKSQESLVWTSPYDWSPDGKLILIFLVKEHENEYKFGLLNVENGSLREFDLIVNPSTNSGFSPDGRYISLNVPQKDDPEKLDIVLYSLAQDKIIPLVENPAEDRGLGWSQDGRWIVFGSDRSGTMDIWALPVTDGKVQGDPVPIKKSMEADLGNAWMTRAGAFCYAINMDYRDVYVAELDFDANRVVVGPKRATQHYVNTNFSPAWSADGRFLAFASRRAEEPRNVLCVLSNGTGEVREFFPALRQFGRPTMILWARDGQSVIHSGFDGSRNPEFYRTDLKTETMSPVLNLKGRRGICLSRDGKTIFYNANHAPGGPAQLMAYDLETKKAETLLNVAGFLQGLALAPDGGKLVFSEEVGPGTEVVVCALKIFPVEGGEPRTIFETDKGGWIETLDWTPDGRFILFTQMAAEKDGKNTKDHIWMISAQGGEPRETGISSDSIRHLRVSPDGRHIAYTSGKRGKEVWAIEKFLPKTGNAK